MLSYILIRRVVQKFKKLGIVREDQQKVADLKEIGYIKELE